MAGKIYPGRSNYLFHGFSCCKYMYLFNSMQEFCAKCVVKHLYLCHFYKNSRINVVVCQISCIFVCGEWYTIKRCPTARNGPISAKWTSVCKVCPMIAHFCANSVVFRLFLGQIRPILGYFCMLFSRTIGCCVAQHVKIFAYSRKCPYLCGTLKT